MNHVEKCFRVIFCPEDKKLDLVTYMLHKRAKDWWRLIENRSADAGSLPSTDFKKAFKDKYYPKSYCDEKRIEFLRLVQGSMFVAEYEKKFTELARYALALKAKKADKCKRFEEGL